MITRFKIFESIHGWNYKFKIGDIVRHISDRYADEMYKVVDIDYDRDPDGFVYSLKPYDGQGDEDNFDEIDLWSEDQMLLIPDYAIDAKRYNL